jgi:hypothetical protein
MQLASFFISYQLRQHFLPESSFDDLERLCRFSLSNLVVLVLESSVISFLQFFGFQLGCFLDRC